MRFRKEFLKALHADRNGRVEVDSLNKILVNIGRTDQLLSERELQTVLQEAKSSNTEDRTIPTSAVLQLV